MRQNEEVASFFFRLSGNLLIDCLVVESSNFCINFITHGLKRVRTTQY